MRYPMLSRISCQREALDTLVVVVVIARMEKNPKTCLRENGVRENGKNVKLGQISGRRCAMMGYQELLDGQVRELHHARVAVVDDGDQACTRGQHSCLLVGRTRGC